MDKDNYKNFLLIRPILDGMLVDSYGMPVIFSDVIQDDHSGAVRITNFKNLRSIIDRKNTIVDFFNYDTVLNSLWNDPMRYVSKFSGLLAVASPDFSVYPEMNKFEIEHNIYKSRWIGALWQLNGLNVIPTISWANEDTYDVCFSGIKEKSVVIISTLGVARNKSCFLKGFFEMRRRIKPSLIIVVGRIFEEMRGKFLLYSLQETFNPAKKCEQLTLFAISHYLEVKEECEYGR